jgi:polyhydroxybutyrate depolymerase
VKNSAPAIVFYQATILAVCLAAAFPAHGEDALARREWKVDGVLREALVHAPASAKTNRSPVVFAFHGHGGTMRSAARTFGFHRQWPEAIVVYMQGLNTPGRLTDPEGRKPGWQHGAGEQGDRDLKFFDAVLASLKRDYRVDEKRIYASGHSNGGGFTYLLWAMRGEHFAAFAPSASVGRPLLQTDEVLWRELIRLRPIPPEHTNSISQSAIKADGKRFVPKPVLHVAGDNDPLVKFEWQKLMIQGLRKFNQCGEGKPWLKDKRCTIYESKSGAPVVTYIHQRKHAFPANATEIIVTFFKEYPGGKAERTRRKP